MILIPKHHQQQQQHIDGLHALRSCHLEAECCEQIKVQRSYVYTVNDSSRLLLSKQTSARRGTRGNFPTQHASLMTQSRRNVTLCAGALWTRGSFKVGVSSGRRPAGSFIDREYFYTMERRSDLCLCYVLCPASPVWIFQNVTWYF